MVGGSEGAEDVEFEQVEEVELVGAGVWMSGSVLFLLLTQVRRVAWGMRRRWAVWGMV